MRQVVAHRWEAHARKSIMVLFAREMAEGAPLELPTTISPHVLLTIRPAAVAQCRSSKVVPKFNLKLALKFSPRLVHRFNSLLVRSLSNSSRLARSLKLVRKFNNPPVRTRLLQQHALLVASAEVVLEAQPVVAVAASVAEVVAAVVADVNGTLVLTLYN